MAVVIDRQLAYLFGNIDSCALKPLRDENGNREKNNHSGKTCESAKERKEEKEKINNCQLSTNSHELHKTQIPPSQYLV
jgi:hypothetical protein